MDSEISWTDCEEVVLVTAHEVVSTYNRREAGTPVVSLRCACGWEGHWHSSAAQARAQFVLHKELHTDA